MRILISVLLLTATFSVLAQRVEFEDPDLTFSIKKPKKWELVDDGYVVKVAPSLLDTATIYASFTYFEAPTPIDYAALEMDTEVPVLIPLQASNEYSAMPQSGNETKIAGTEAVWSETRIEENGLVQLRRIYRFEWRGQQWDIVTNVPVKEARAHQRTLSRIVKSLKISD